LKGDRTEEEHIVEMEASLSVYDKKHPHVRLYPFLLSERRRRIERGEWRLFTATHPKLRTTK
jgi:hypothetical protein